MTLWIESNRADPEVVPMADRHYNRQKMVASHSVVSLPVGFSSSLTMKGHRGMTSCFRQEAKKRSHDDPVPVCPVDPDWRSSR